MDTGSCDVNPEAVAFEQISVKMVCCVKNNIILRLVLSFRVCEPVIMTIIHNSMRFGDFSVTLCQDRVMPSPAVCVRFV